MALHVHLLVDRIALEPSLKREINAFLYYCKTFYGEFASTYVDYLPVEDFEDHFIENYHNRYTVISEAFRSQETPLEEKIYTLVLQ